MSQDAVELVQCGSGKFQMVKDIEQDDVGELTRAKAQGISGFDLVNPGVMEQIGSYQQALIISARLLLAKRRPLFVMRSPVELRIMYRFLAAPVRSILLFRRRDPFRTD